MTQTMSTEWDTVAAGVHAAATHEGNAIRGWTRPDGRAHGGRSACRRDVDADVLRALKRELRNGFDMVTGKWKA
jgi:hypothetical protein